MSLSSRRAKNIITRQIKKGTIPNDREIKMFKYYKVYPTPTENTKECLKHIDFTHINNVLTGVEGPTQPFDIAAKGVKNIDVFDNNVLNEYFILGLMMATINKYDYEDFLAFYSKIKDPNISLEHMTTLILDLLPYMDTEYRLHWQSVVDYNYKLQKEKPKALNLILMLSYSYADTMTNVCGFLNSEGEYNQLKANLAKTNIKFTRANPLELHKKFNGNEYDLIYLASSLDHLASYGVYDWSYEYFCKYLSDLSVITDDFGIIAANAININEIRVWRNSRVTEEDLKGHTIHRIPNAFDPSEEELLVLTRKIGF